MSTQRISNNFQSPSESPDIMSAADKKNYSEVTIDNKKVYHCLLPDCGKAFKFLSEMKRHLTVHSKQRPFVCSFPDCGKTFKRADALSNHFRIHSRNTPFICSEDGCEAQFVTKSALKYHQLKHSGERTFKCSQDGCDKTFMTQAQLRQHEKASVYHQRIGGNSPSDLKDCLSPKDQEGVPYACEKEDLESNEGDKSEFLSYDQNFDLNGADEQLDNNEQVNYFDQVYSQLGQNFDETSSVETNAVPTRELLKKRNADPHLISLLNFVMEENRQLKKKIKAMSEVPSFNAYDMYQPDKPNNDIDLFFRSSSEIQAEQETFFTNQQTFHY